MMEFENSTGKLMIKGNTVVYETSQLVKTFEPKSGDRAELEQLFEIRKSLMEMDEDFPIEA